MTKVIVITGCSAGFGFDGAKQLASKGHIVHATMRNVDGKNADAASQLRNFATSESVKLKVAELDVESDDSVSQAIASIAADEGRIDVLINNAGLGYGGPGETILSSQFARQLDVNVVGAHRCTNAVLPHMRKQRSGLLIHVTSVAGRITMPGFALYCASKYALEAYGEALRYELGGLGIESVIVEPGPFDTSFFTNMVPGGNPDVMAAYGNIGEYIQGFMDTVQGMFKDESVPTDPKLVADAFVDLVDAPHGQRPVRTVVGLDFGVRAINDQLESARQEAMKANDTAAFDQVATN